MKEKVMKKWVRALRSGKYKQGEGCLKQTSKKKTYHCCLGVLCELYNSDMKKNKKKRLNETKHTGGMFKFDNNAECLPKVVVKWAGLETNAGHFSGESTKNSPYDSLVMMNDLGVKFKTIADAIEKNWENI